MYRKFLTLVCAALGVVLVPQMALAQGTGGAPTTGGATGLQSLLGGAGGGAPRGTTSTTSTATTTLKTVAIQSGAGSATGIPSASNPNAVWYGDPYSMGLSTKFNNGVAKPTVTFGKANYTSTAQSATNQGAGGASTTTTATNYGTQPGTVRNPSYVTVLRDDFPVPVYKSDVLFTEVRDVIARSSLLPSKNNIQVSVNENVVILSGLVASDRERILVEGIVKMTPGVRTIQNQIQVKAK